MFKKTEFKSKLNIDNISPTWDDLRAVNLHEPFLRQSVPEDFGHAPDEPEDRLIGRGPQVKDPVVEADVLVDRRQLGRKKKKDLNCATLQYGELENDFSFFFCKIQD